MASGRWRVLLAAVVLAAGCPSRDADRVMRDTWQQIDLWRVPPEAGGTPELQGELATIRGRALRTLKTGVGSRLVWRLELGDDARLSFRPLPEEPGCIYAVTVRDPQGEREVLRQTYPPATENPAPVVTVPLAGAAGVPLAAAGPRPIDLVLEILDSEEHSCRHGHWGSPVILSRTRIALAPPAEKPNILLLGIDTLRADALGVYGRTPSVSPAIDGLAAESDVWLTAFASANSTNPSFISLMTGLYSKNHGVYDLKTPLPDDQVTLAMRLRDAGYHTRAVISVAHLARFSGLRRGFDEFVGSERQFYAETAVDIAIDWLQEIEQPYFLWLHLFDPHVPHNPPQPYDQGYLPVTPAGLAPVAGWREFRSPGPRAFQKNRRRLPGHPDLYLGEVAYVDRQIDRLLSFLRSRGALDHTLVALVGDHGETLGERGHFFDHDGLHDNTTHVPLMVRWPGAGESRRIPGLVQHFDLFPTLLEAAGVEVPRQDGVSLRRMKNANRGRPAVFSESALRRIQMIRTAELKYTVTKIDERPPIIELYDLVEDPAELANLAGTDHPAEAHLGEQLAKWLDDRLDAEKPRSLDLDAEDQEQLEALGYIQ